jgi:sec-independent protein translocase protein TatB
MLPSLGFNEIIILGILALIVVGPKDLPLLFRKLGRWTAKLRGMAQEFRTGFDELARQAELDELRREVDALRRTTSLQEVGRELTKPLPTLEDYAGLKSRPAVSAASSSTEETPRSSPTTNEPHEAPPESFVQAPPQSSLHDDSSSVDEERDVAPVARSAP